MYNDKSNDTEMRDNYIGPRVCNVAHARVTSLLRNPECVCDVIATWWA